MPSLEEELATLVGQAAEVFDWPDLQTEEVDIEIAESDDLPFPYSDIKRESSEEVFRLFVVNRDLDFQSEIGGFFEYFRDLEDEHEDSGATLVWRGMEDEEFWYLRRTDEGEIGLFHSEFSFDDEEDEEEEEEV